MSTMPLVSPGLEDIFNKPRFHAKHSRKIDLLHLKDYKDWVLLSDY